jgi:hypothetical protein
VSPETGRVRALLSWFLPDALAHGEPETAQRALLTVVACSIGAGVAALIALLQLAWGVREAALAAAGCALVCAVLPLWIRRSGAWRPVAFALCGAIWLSAFTVAVATGGALVAALYYLSFTAALAAMILGARTATLLTLASTVSIAALYVLRTHGVPFPVAVDAEIGLLSAMRGALTFQLALLPLVVAHEWMRLRTLRESQRSERRYRALADHGPDLIAELDASGRIVHSSTRNPALLASLRGRLALDGIHRDDRASVREALRSLEAQPSVRAGPYRWVVGRNEALWFEASLTRFRDEGDERLLVVARDVGERLALEAKLRQSQKMEAIGRLAGGAAHDFNNLLMAISGSAELLLAAAASEEDLRVTVGEILRATEHGADLTRRLLALARPTAMSRRALDLNGVVGGLEKMLSRLIGEHVVLVLDLAPELDPVHADPGEIEQVLLNLALNARDAMPGGGTLRISTRPHPAGTSLEVADSGAGLDPLIRERIFEPFFSTKHAEQGAGLGLFVVYSIVNDLGGAIRVESKPGEGACFRVDLPRSREPLARQAAATPSDGAGGRERILVVEDRRELRELMRATLEAAGYAILTAADGIEALALADTRNVDLVVTDVVMPRLGGKALVRALRQTNPRLRALFVSGHLEHASDPGALDDGERLLRKPFPLEGLRRAVREVLDAPPRTSAER